MKKKLDKNLKTMLINKNIPHIFDLETGELYVEREGSFVCFSNNRDLFNFIENYKKEK